MAPRARDPRSELFVSLAERIRAADGKSTAELAALAREVEERMENLDDVEPQIREMLLRRQRAMAAQDAPAPPRTPEPAAPEKAAPVLRQCMCGCGAMLVCGSGADAGMTEFCRRELSDPSPPPPVDPKAQRAYCQQLSRPRKLPAVKTEEIVPTPACPSRPPNYERLSQMAKPREEPPPPPPEPPFRAMPAPSFTKPSKSPCGMRRSSLSAPDLRIPTPPESTFGQQSMLGLRARDSLRQLASGAPPSHSMPFDGDAVGASSQLVELRCHALKSKCFMLPSTGLGRPLLPGLGEDFADTLSMDDTPEKKRHVSASSQRRYTEEHLYRKPLHGAPGSTSDLQARLEALRMENKARDRTLQAEERQKPKKKWNVRAKINHRRDVPTEIAAEIS